MKYFYIILLQPLIQEGLVSFTGESMYIKYWLTAKSKFAVRLTDHLNMTMFVDWDVKPQTKQTKKQ